MPNRTPLCWFLQTGHLDVDGTIDGIDVSVESVLLTTMDQSFHGNLTFLGDLYYQGSVAVGGLVAGVDLHELREEAVYSDAVHNITGNLGVIIWA